MKIRLEIGTDEIKEAIREWLANHGVPPVLQSDFVIAYLPDYAGTWQASPSTKFRVTMEFEVDSYSSQEPKK